MPEWNIQISFIYAGPVERGGLPGLVPVIFETLVTLKREIEWSPGGFKIIMKVESLWLQKHSTGPGYGN